jgi:lipid-A-disaccharide synthase
MNSFLIVAGENSGERHGADLVEQYRRLDSDAVFFGIGGERMQAAGVQLTAHVRDLSLTGIFEILSQLPRIKRIYRRLQSEVRERQPQAAVLIDAPDFNLRLARFLKNRGVPVLYYISPTVWAWRRGRLKTIRRSIDRMLLIFPFERDLYARHKIPAVFVGHPLMREIGTVTAKSQILDELGLDPRRPLIALLPGSREIEIRHHLPTLAAAVHSISADRPVQFVLLKAGNLDRAVLDRFIPARDKHLIRILDGNHHDVLAASDLALSSCGTANLEAALLETPLVAFYRVSPLTYILARPFMRIARYSIVNILAGEDVVPELIQGNFTPDELTHEALSLLDDERRRTAMIGKFRGIKESLGRSDAALGAALELDSLVSDRGNRGGGRSA